MFALVLSVSECAVVCVASGSLHHMKITFTFTENRWFPMSGDLIDKRGTGFKSKAAILRWKKEREECTGEKIVVKFV